MAVGHGSMRLRRPLGSWCRPFPERTNQQKYAEGIDRREVRIRKLHGSFSGALVLLATPIADGRELPSSVLKYDLRADVEDEAAKTEEHGRAFGPTYPTVHEVQVADEHAIMMIDLCGGTLSKPYESKDPCPP